MNNEHNIDTICSEIRDLLFPIQVNLFQRCEKFRTTEFQLSFFLRGSTMEAIIRKSDKSRWVACSTWYWHTITMSGMLPNCRGSFHTNISYNHPFLWDRIAFDEVKKVSNSHHLNDESVREKFHFRILWKIPLAETEERHSVNEYDAKYLMCAVFIAVSWIFCYTWTLILSHGK